MAGFKTHITVSTLTGIAYGAWGYHSGAPLETCILAGGLCSVSGMLPDLDSDSGRPGHGFLQRRQTLADQFGTHAAQSGDVAAWAGKASDETALDRIVDVDHDDGNRCRRLLGREGRLRDRCDEDIDPETYQLSRKEAKPLVVSGFRRTGLDGDVPSLHVAKLVESLAERLNEMGSGTRRGGADKANLPNLPSLLRFCAERRERPGQRG